MQSGAIGRATAAVIVIVIVIVGGIGAIAYISFMAPTTTTTSAPKPITVLLAFIPDGQVVPLYAALEEGYYSQAGFSVTIDQGQGSGFSLSTVGQGKADFGVADVVTSTVLASEGNLTAKIVMQYQDGIDMGVASYTPLTSPKDMENKTFGTFAFDDTRPMLKVVMSLNGANYSEVTQDLVNPAILDSSFLQHQYQTVASFTDVDYPLFQAQSSQPVYEYVFSQWGLKVPGAVIIASPQMVQDNPSEVSAFLSATIKGVQFSISNPSAAVADMAKSVPSINQSIVLSQLKQAIPLFQTSNAINHYGWINSTELQQGVAQVEQGYGITTSVNISSMYTNRFLPSSNVSVG